MKIKYLRLKSMLLACAIAVTSSGLTGCSDKEAVDNGKIVSEKTTSFEAGKHIISVPISPKNDIRFKNVQYDYYPCYEPIGISITAHGKFDNDFGGGAIIYSNVEEVECSSVTVDENGNYKFLDFGTPKYIEEEEKNQSNGIEEFDVGEHIISIPIKEDNRYNYFQYEYHEGYEVIGIATSAHGMFDNDFGGGVLLYKNTSPVRCIRGDEGCTSFGIPFEKEYTKKLN